MNKCVSYIRFSSEIQGLGDSFRRQSDLAKKYCEAHKLTLIESFHDLGISAYKKKNLTNGALGEFLELAKSGKFSKGTILLIENFDRLSRTNVLDAFDIVKDILRQGIKIVTLSDNQEYSLESLSTNIGSLFTSLAVMIRANEESSLKSQRLKATWKKKRDEAIEKPISSICPSWLKYDSDSKSFKVIEENAKIIQRMYEIAKSGIGSPSIATLFNKEDLKPFTRSEKWFDSSIKHFLSNRAVLGEYQPCYYSENRKPIPAGEPIKDYYPSIISVEDFESVQRLIDSRQIFTSKGRKGSQFSNLYSGLLKCPICKEPIRYVDKRSKNGRNKYTKPYFQCRSYVISKTCNNSKWKVEEFEEEFFRFVKKFDLNIILNENNNNQKNLTNDLQVISNDLEALRAQKSKELQSLESNLELNLNPFILQSLSKRLEKLEESIKDKQKALNDLEAEIKALDINNYQQGFKDFKSLSERLEGLSVSERFSIRQRLNNILKTLIDSIYLYNSECDLYGYEIHNEPDNDFIGERFMNHLKGLGYKTLNEMEVFIDTDKGKREWQKWNRFFIVIFKNGETVEVRPSQGFSVERITTEELKRRLHKASKA